MGFFHIHTIMQVKTFRTSKDSSSSIYTGCSSNIYKEIVGNGKHVIISSENIIKNYPALFANNDHIIISDSEDNKTLQTIEEIISQLIKFGVDRNSYIIGIGGGIICDITGFVANIYMRGTKFGLIPTTLLSQIDAAIGGKNGVNFNGLKNFIGSFASPDFIIIDSSFIRTLPEIQYKSGLGEAIKYALIGNNEIMNMLSCNAKEILLRDHTVVSNLVDKSIDSKISIAEKDPEDKGIRHILNFGHTIGHSIEIIDGIPHGLAVIKGINAATDVSTRLGLLDDNNAARIKNLLVEYGYDIAYSINDEHIKALSNDKKKGGNSIKMVLLQDIGNPIIKEMTIPSIIDLIR